MAVVSIGSHFFHCFKRKVKLASFFDDFALDLQASLLFFIHSLIHLTFILRFLFGCCWRNSFWNSKRPFWRRLFMSFLLAMEPKTSAHSMVHHISNLSWHFDELICFLESINVSMNGVIEVFRFAFLFLNSSPIFFSSLFALRWILPISPTLTSLYAPFLCFSALLPVSNCCISILLFLTDEFIENCWWYVSCYLWIFIPFLIFFKSWRVGDILSSRIRAHSTKSRLTCDQLCIALLYLSQFWHFYLSNRFHALKLLSEWIRIFPWLSGFQDLKFLFFLSNNLK